ncbi:unnamed protein product [Xylocopa violacea]|uniref:Uncharacterized protein n=1 Tax=Xylocopa violacea TaxID=135666 RepID=A0ABP1N3M2_XYLVO
MGLMAEFRHGQNPERQRSERQQKEEKEEHHRTEHQHNLLAILEQVIRRATADRRVGHQMSRYHRVQDHQDEQRHHEEHDYHRDEETDPPFSIKEVYNTVSEIIASNRNSKPLPRLRKKKNTVTRISPPARWNPSSWFRSYSSPPRLRISSSYTAPGTLS